MHLMMVVLPVPGPPVMTHMPLRTAVRMASFCCSWKAMPSMLSSVAICVSMSALMDSGMAASISPSLRATSASAR